jgi:hypothetical protein
MAVQDQIQSRIQAFARELETLVRQAAIDAVAHSLGGAAARVPASNGRPAAAVATPRGRKSKSKGPGGKRDPKVLAALTVKVGEWVKENPGKGVEDMGKALSKGTGELALPIAKLLAAKTIKKKGVKRATKYFPS